MDLSRFRSLTPYLEEPCKDCQGEYDNGMNTYEGIASNPVGYTDPVGRDWLDDEGILTTTQTWGLATEQIALASGQLISLASIGQSLRDGLRAFWTEAGTRYSKWVDCIEKYDPTAFLEQAVGAAIDFVPLPFAPLPKSWLSFGDDLERAKSTGTPGSIWSRLTRPVSRLGEWGPRLQSKLKFLGRAISGRATPVFIAHGLYMAGVEIVCGTYYGALGK